MKKILLIFAVIMVFFLPSNVNAENVKINFYDVDANLYTDGTLDVKEHVKLSAKTSITVRNNYINSNGLNSLLYVGMDNDFYGSDIYSASIINNVAIMSLDGSKKKKKKKFTALGEEYYLKDVEDFYIVYKLGGVVVKHPDYSELYYNFFKDKFDYIIENSTVTVKLPKTSNYIKADDYTYLNNITITDNKVVAFKYFYGAKNKNIRVVFDNGIVTPSKVVDKNIGEFVNNDLTNGFIEKAKYYICIILTIVFYLNFIRLVILVIKKYGRNKKYKTYPSLDESLIRRYNYAGINYLINKDVTVDAFLSGIIDLINSGKLCIIKENGDFYITRGNSGALNVEDEYLVNFLLEVIDKKYKASLDMISFSKLKKFCKDNSTVSSFIVNLNVWKTLQVKNAREYRFMVGNEYYFSLKKSLIFSYILLIINVLARTNFALGIVAFIPVTLLVNVMLKLTKRSQFAEEAYKGILNFKDGLLKLTESTSNPYRWDLFLIDAVSMDCGIELENIIKKKIRNGTLNEHYNSRIIDLYRTYPDFMIVSDLLPVLRAANKKSFFIYTKGKNNL